MDLLYNLFMLISWNIFYMTINFKSYLYDEFFKSGVNCAKEIFCYNYHK